MKKLKINLKNCYGISKLEHEFDFTKKNIAIIYASNGTMKSSLANTFSAIKNGDEPRDRIFNKRGIYEITDEAGKKVEGKNIIVINPFQEDKIIPQELIPLIVNSDLRDKYDEIYRMVEVFETKKKDLYSKIDSILNIKINIQDYILSLWNEKKLYDCFKAIYSSLDSEEMDCDLDFENLKNYKILFDDNVVKEFNKEDLSRLIEEYTDTYKKLIEESPYMMQGFGYNNFIKIKKALNDYDFFIPNNKIILKNKNNNEDKIINSVEELEKILENEKNRVIYNNELKSKFDEINNRMQANQELRNLFKFLYDYQSIVCEYRDIEKFKKKVWNKAFLSYKSTLKDLIVELENINKRLEPLNSQIENEKTDWKKAIDIFTRRFHVPFTIELCNQTSVIFKTEMPIFKFKYERYFRL